MSAEPIRLLLVEDDPISLDFLSEALSGVPAQVDAAGDIASASGLARERPSPGLPSRRYRWRSIMASAPSR